MVLCSLLLAALLFAVFKYLKLENVEPIFGVYKQPGKWYYLKYLAFWCILNSRRVFGKLGSRLRQSGYGMKSRSTPEEMDKAQQLSSHTEAFDAVFFMATNKEGYYLVGGSERRHDGIVNGLFYLVVPGKGLLCSKRIPSTQLHGAKPNEFGAEGIRFTPIVPMKHWRIEYNGSMWFQNEPGKSSNVEIQADWRSDLPFFDFDTDLAIAPTCRAIAREDWSKEYFDSLKAAHQTHYEQMGSLKANINIEGKVYEFEGQAFRDHSYGFKRDWTLMHRYIFHMLFLEDGTMASIGVICQPCTCSTLEAGYVYEPDGSLHPLEWCDLKLYQHGENGTAPKDHAFTFKAGEKVYNVQVNVEYESIHFVGKNWEARMVERFVRYRVNGTVDGRGISEFHYRNKNGRTTD
ncbi:uncharacterized protein LOC107219278 [Neodiprion lecontei]|uniref:Uncharacterized protein LOC107219278 n=1 Tax=Neodiprion lecontei TaxID=441921 RepID=A0A6J0BEX5_NEOLC|nr:uncharacterized protein LOC107219278 [Neodiprion lecontei]